MENPANYYPDGVTQVMKLIKETLGGEFTYFDDELLDVDQTQLPCVMVFEGQGGAQSGATGTDDLGEEVNIVVAFNQKDDLGATEKTDLTGAKLRRLVKGQDPTTQEYKEGTIMHTLRTKFTLENGSVDNKIDLDFSPNVRGDNVFTKEAYITIRIERIVAVPNRT